MEQLISKYLRDINLPIYRKYCEKLIASHPDYPSMLSIADTLQRLGIRYKAARIAKKHLNNIEYPYLLWPNEKGGEPKIVKDKQDLLGDRIQNQDNIEAGKPTIVLKAEPADTITDEEHNRQLSQDRFFKLLSGVLVVAVAGLILLSTQPSLTWVFALLLLTSLAGTVIGYLLIAKEVGINYKPVEAFCRAGKRTNCDTLLSSDAARLFGDKVTFSDATASYFLFQLLVVGFLLPSGEPSFLWILSGLSALTIPIIGYSLWYQMVETKTWCRLCLIVDGILAVQAGFFGYLYYDSLAGAGYPGLDSLAVALLLFGTAGSAVLLIKNKFQEAKKATEADVRASRIKYNTDVFLHLIRHEIRVDATPFEQEMLVGKAEAPIRILLAANLKCGSCEESFEKATQMIKKYPDKINLSIRFWITKNNNGRNLSSGQYHFFEYWLGNIYKRKDASIRTARLIRDWYKLKYPTKFKEAYQMKNNGVNDEIVQLVSRHIAWFDETGIEKTPAFFINGHQLPKNYQIKDLKEMMPGLVEEGLWEGSLI